MGLSVQDVEHIAHLARLELRPEQKSALSDQLSAILDYAALLDQLDLDAVEPTTHAVPLRNVWREDAVEGTLTRKQIFANAPAHRDDHFAVQTILDSGE